MARLSTIGFELNSANTGMEYTAGAGGAIDATVKHSGAYGFRVSALSSGAAKGAGANFWIV